MKSASSATTPRRTPGRPTQDYDIELAPTTHAARRAGALKSIDETLSFRRSCREGVCGSDAMTSTARTARVHHQPARAEGAGGAEAAARPAGDPRLVVDMSQFFKQYHSIKPYSSTTRRRRNGAPAVGGGPRGTGRPLRVHPVRVLLDGLPVVLVEPGQVRRTGRAAAGLPLHRRQPRPGGERAARQPRGPIPAVPLLLDHELRRRVPEGPQPDARDRQDQGPAGQAGV